MVSAEWPRPARPLGLCLLSVEEVRVLIVIKCLTRGNKLVVFSVTSIGAPSSSANVLSGRELRGGLVGRGSCKKHCKFLFRITLYSQSFP